MGQLFFELIRVAIGTQNTLSRPPSKGEWAELYTMAKKQSLVGICFAAVQKLQCNDNQELRTQNPQSEPTNNQALELCSLRSAGAEEPITQNLDEVQYLTWMGMAAKIQQRNEVVNRQCVVLQAKLSADGFHPCVLKGQGVAQMYGSLVGLRQSGDIDLWIAGDYQQTINCLKKIGVVGTITANHAEAHFFQDTEVEVHPVPAIFRNPFTNRKWRRFCKEHENDWVDVNVDSTNSPCSFKMPSVEFNLVFLMVHMYQHLLREGIGLRQFLDYYFVFSNQLVNKSTGQQAMKVIESLGMKNFAAGVMDIMYNVFGLEEDRLLCPADPGMGAFLLDEIMQGGNFGHYDERNKVVFDNGSNPLHRVAKGMIRNSRFLRFGFWEIVCSPLWRLWHFCWMKKNGYR